MNDFAVSYRQKEVPLSLLLDLPADAQQRDFVEILGSRQSLEEGPDVRQVGIAYELARIWGHVAGGLANISDES